MGERLNSQNHLLASHPPRAVRVRAHSSPHSPARSLVILYPSNLRPDPLHHALLEHRYVVVLKPPDGHPRLEKQVQLLVRLAVRLGEPEVGPHDDDRGRRGGEGGRGGLGPLCLGDPTRSGSGGVGASEPATYESIGASYVVNDAVDIVEDAREVEGLASHPYRGHFSREDVRERRGGKVIVALIRRERTHRIRL